MIDVNVPYELDGGVFSPTLFILPASKHYLSSEVLLWRSVIERAMRDAFGQCGVPETEQALLQHQAIQWLTGNSKDYYEVCDMAQVNPVTIHKSFMAAHAANDLKLALKEIK